MVENVSLLSFLGCHMLPFCQIEKLYSDVILVIFTALMWQIFNFYPMHVNACKTLLDVTFKHTQEA